MKTLNNSSFEQYAVIQIRQSDGGVERFVMGYHDECTLRQFLAKSSIFATGFSSRDEATKKLFMEGIGDRMPSGKLIHALPGSRLLRMFILKMRTLSGLQSRVGTPKVMHNVVHLAGTALRKIQSRLAHARRPLEPVVQ